MKYRKYLIVSFFILLFQYDGLNQNVIDFDSTAFQLFHNKKIIYADYGYNTAPFSLKFKGSSANEHLYYRNNLRSVIGIGFAYKWFSIRFAFNPPGYLKPVEKYGSNEYYDVGLDFKTKKHFFDINLHNYRGYAIKNAYVWNDSLDETSNPNYIQSQTNALSFSINAWRFLNKNISFLALNGKKGRYLKKQYSFYLKTTCNLHGISNNGSLIPSEKQNLAVSQTQASTISALDFGVVPGFVYVNRIRNWQFSGMFGFGPVIQNKFYYYNGLSRSFVGLAPRYDVRFSLGYNTSNYFVNLNAEFDNKSIQFSNLKYVQTFYMIKLVLGIRFGNTRNIH